MKREPTGKGGKRNKMKEETYTGGNEGKRYRKEKQQGRKERENRTEKDKENRTEREKTRQEAKRKRETGGKGGKRKKE